MSLRIEAGVTRGPRVRFRVNGKEIEAYEGESVGTALLAAGVRVLRHAPVDGGPRGLFCAMGICQECVVEADGHLTEACRLAVRPNLDIRIRK